MGRAKKQFIIKVIMTVLMGVISIIMLLPFAWMLSASFKPDNMIFNFPIEWIPSKPTIQNYIKVWADDVPFVTFF